MRRVEVAKKILQERNQKLPDLGWNAGLYLFEPSRPFFSMKRYNREEFGQAIDKLPTVTRVPPSRAKSIQALDGLLSGLSGRTAVFFFTDGQFVAPIKTELTPVTAARELAAKYDVCVYPISSAQTPRQKSNVEALAAVNACSRVIPFDALYQRPEYVGGILFALEDRVIVEKDTITKVVGVKMADILFDFDSSEIRPEFHQTLSGLGKFLQEKSAAYVILSGFTDSVGSEEYNLALSQRRAQSVASHLMNSYGIDETRIVTLWYGKADPVTSNATAEGRARNRRVVPVVGGTR
jgi:OOP family OmpA-OmpF porin